MSLKEMMDSAEHSPEPRRRRRWLACGPLVLLLALLVVGGLILFNKGKHLVTPVAEGCQADTADGVVDLTLEQMQNAATIAAVAASRNLPERAVTISLATAMQESHLRNLAGGDRDSLGLFQQRPSQGWGTEAQIADPVYATNKFLDKLVKIPGYAQLPLTEAAQDVQKSGYPDAYAQHEPEATVLSGALSGRVASSLSCTVDGVGTASGTGDLTAALNKEFGKVAAPTAAAAAAAGSSDAASASAAPVQQRVVTVTLRGARQLQHGWAVAEWAVAHAKSLHLTSVGYGGQVWRADASDKGWHADTGTAANGPVRIEVAVATATGAGPEASHSA